MIEHREKVLEVLLDSSKIIDNPTREKMIADAVQHKDAMPLSTGTLAAWTPVESTGRSPKDTYIVRRPESEAKIDWTSPNCIPMAPETFDMIYEYALAEL